MFWGVAKFTCQSVTTSEVVLFKDIFAEPKFSILFISSFEHIFDKTTSGIALKRVC